MWPNLLHHVDKHFCVRIKVRLYKYIWLMCIKRECESRKPFYRYLRIARTKCSHFIMHNNTSGGCVKCCNFWVGIYGYLNIRNGGMFARFTSEQCILNGKESKFDFDWLNSCFHLLLASSCSSSLITDTTDLQFDAAVVNR